ncbi:isoprenylcysteine carboxylmethyltransferase family protein [Bermanella marisrubri]|uniref:Isoprenylcysteine carboxylmethyltransferase family protein n=1 Tax=Bermanella marisrubri TaxID=207949 RepID=Q1N2D0_9GAMM|nr:isoprenylcysteine carboxylmethyltransferase family protein [Bermanella marisrubri]EAT12477.1 putative protein-S-isoprenylcysteine methyltransferase [Oceanobacter sp. RED65] [Bermanella marisrubri]QIZ85554.1 isoprenylcysteine carboxylmethyltransferase family protein [Bermanella marisrubri]
MKRLELLIPPVPLTLIFALTMWLIHSYLSWASVLSLPVSISALFFAIGLFFIIPAVISFIENKTTVDPRVPEKSKTLVVSGLYRFTRNPMYLGMLCCLLSMASYQGNVISYGLCVVFVFYMNRFQISQEEAALSQQFGKDYEAYCHRVRRWI